MQCCADVRATYIENNKHHNFESNGGDREGVWIILFFAVTLFEYIVSTILSPIVALSLYLIIYLNKK